MREQMIGTWELVSWTWTFDEDGRVEPERTFGQDAFGRIIYSADGYMCAALMKRNRPNFTSKDLRGGTNEEKLAAFETYIAYCGKFEVSEDDRSVVHTVDTSLYPNWTGSLQKRYVDLSGGKLTLTTPKFLIKGEQAVGILTWQRVR